MSRYAAGTDVTSDRSRAEIERTLRRYGADAFSYGWDGDRAVVGFRARGRQARFILPLPDRASPEFSRTPTGKPKSTTAAEAAYEQAVRQSWRALALVIKAKLEAVEAGIVSFDDEFMAHLVLPGGRTVSEHFGGQLAIAIEGGAMPALLPRPSR